MDCIIQGQSLMKRRLRPRYLPERENRLPMYAERNTWKKGVTRSLIPWTYPLAGCRIAQTYKIRSKLCVYQCHDFSINNNRDSHAGYSRASRAVLQVASEEHQFQFDARSADQDLRDLAQKPAGQVTGIHLAFEPG
jgi:hypothetical protein